MLRSLFTLTARGNQRPSNRPSVSRTGQRSIYPPNRLPSIYVRPPMYTRPRADVWLYRPPRQVRSFSTQIPIDNVKQLLHSLESGRSTNRSTYFKLSDSCPLDEILNKHKYHNQLMGKDINFIDTNFVKLALSDYENRHGWMAAFSGFGGIMSAVMLLFLHTPVSMNSSIGPSLCLAWCVWRMFYHFRATNMAGHYYDLMSSKTTANNESKDMKIELIKSLVIKHDH